MIILQILVEKRDDSYKLLKYKKIKSYLQEKSLSFLLSQVYIIVAVEKENFYNKILETLASIIFWMQQENAFAVQKIKKVQQVSQFDKNLTF